MTYVENDLLEVLFVGTTGGSVQAFHLNRSPRSTKPENISGDNNHSGSVTCLLFLTNPEISCGSSGVLVSGSVDRTIKLWSPQNTKNTAIQTLFGHEATITSVIDGQDGTLISCSIDGSLRVWRPQKGRKIMLHAYMECTYVCKQKDIWLTSIAVNYLKVWVLYVGDMNGGVSIYHKGSDNNEPERRTAVYTGQLIKYRKWEHIHPLGIEGLQIIADESYLITMSFDFTSKVSKSVSSYILYTKTYIYTYIPCIFLMM